MNYSFPESMSLKAYTSGKGMGKHDSSISSMSPSAKIIVDHTRYHKESMRKKEKIHLLTLEAYA